MAGGRSENWPTSEQIARALIAVALGCGELDHLRSDFHNRVFGAGHQARWMVLAALVAAYPNQDPLRMARWLGEMVPDPWLHVAYEIGQRELCRWWRPDLVRVAFHLVAP